MYKGMEKALRIIYIMENAVSLHANRDSLLTPNHINPCLNWVSSDILGFIRICHVPFMNMLYRKQ